MSDRDGHFLDAVALVRATQRGDSQAAARVLGTSNLYGLAIALAQMMPTAIEAQGFTVDEFLEVQVSVSLLHSGPEESNA